MCRYYEIRYCLNVNDNDSGNVTLTNRLMCPVFNPDSEKGWRPAGRTERKGGDPFPARAAGCPERDHSRWSCQQASITSPLLTFAHSILRLHTDRKKKHHSTGGRTLS